MALVITGLAGLDERRNQIESSKHTLKDGRKDTMERIDDVKQNVVVEQKKKSNKFFLILFCHLFMLVLKSSICTCYNICG